MSDENPHASSNERKGRQQNFKHWRNSLVLSIPASLILWVTLIFLYFHPTIHHWAGFGAVLVGSAAGATLGFANRWFILFGSIAGGAIVFPVTVLTVVTLLGPPDGVPDAPRLFTVLAIYAGIGAGFGLLFGITTTLFTWGSSLFLCRQGDAQQGTAAERPHLH